MFNLSGYHFTVALQTYICTQIASSTITFCFDQYSQLFEPVSETLNSTLYVVNCSKKVQLASYLAKYLHHLIVTLLNLYLAIAIAHNISIARKMY